MYAELRDGAAYVGGSDRASLARAYSLFAFEYKKHNGGDFRIEQEPLFKNRGVMLDFSRNGVMKPEQVKRYISEWTRHTTSVWATISKSTV